MAEQHENNSSVDLRAADNPSNQKNTAQIRRLKARRQVEDHWEQQRLREHLDDFENY